MYYVGVHYVDVPWIVGASNGQDRPAMSLVIDS